MTTGGTPSPDDIARIVKAGSVGEDQKMLPRTADAFQSYMKEPSNPLLNAGKTSQLSPFDLAHGQVLPTGPTLQTLTAQTVAAHGTLGDLAGQLNTPNLKLKQSSKYLLKNKLSSAKAHIRSASAKLGAKEVEDTNVDAGRGPMQKFIALVTDGQNQLEASQSMLQSLAARGENLNPADMLLVQIKLNKAQQALEYSSMLLSKAVDDMKMLMNIQL